MTALVSLDFFTVQTVGRVRFVLVLLSHHRDRRRKQRLGEQLEISNQRFRELRSAPFPDRQEHKLTRRAAEQIRDALTRIPNGQGAAPRVAEVVLTTLIMSTGAGVFAGELFGQFAASADARAASARSRGEIYGARRSSDSLRFGHYSGPVHVTFLLNFFDELHRGRP